MDEILLSLLQVKSVEDYLAVCNLKGTPPLEVASECILSFAAPIVSLANPTVNKVS